jgi:hypothetical protein
MMIAPPNPLAFISSRSRVMASFVTLPFNHHQYACTRDSMGGDRKPASSPSSASAAPTIIEAHTAAKAKAQAIAMFLLILLILPPHALQRSSIA